VTPETFYDQLTPFYHLIFPDWQASIARQADTLNSIIREFWPNRVSAILDVACGIGTQSLGLAALGYTVTGSDLSSAEVERARCEASKRGLSIAFSVADMRTAYAHHQKQFDLVIACDNAVPHLLSDSDLLTAFEQMFACVRPGGGGLISVRDYDQEDRTDIQMKPYGVHLEGNHRYVVFQVWEFHGLIYDLAMYFVEDDGTNCKTHVMRSQYYAVSIGKLLALMEQAGFHEVQRLDGRYYQPVLLGRKPVASG
jgi:SAM-dependent methyltransferase